MPDGARHSAVGCPDCRQKDVSMRQTANRTAPRGNSLLLGIALALSGMTESQCRADSPAAERHFETQIRPLLVDRCGKCHGARKEWGSLRLDSRAALLKGGDSGPAIVPGKPDESLLIRAVRGMDPDLKMPPAEERPLSAAEIAALEDWVRQGAPFPETPVAKRPFRDPAHWAFQPPALPAVPEVSHPELCRSPLDRFLQQSLDAANLPPASPADRQTLVRRLTFDLTGLPPSPTDIDEFLADTRPDAIDRLVDRLLASPAYGERWGRHWLDVARYADSNGLDENVAHGNAWRYRDYVVSAWNSDLPYDRFLQEQLAGDLLPASDWQERNRLKIATGFLAIGPKVLAEVDEAKMQMDIVDEQIDTVGRAVLGLTLGCARCHDHKFDPIDTADYYGLAGIFKSTRTMEHFRKVARWYENPLDGPETESLKQAHEARLTKPRAALREAKERADAQARAALPPDTPPPADLEPQYPDSVKVELKRLRDEIASLEKQAPELPSAMGVSEDKVTDVAIHIRGNPLKLGKTVPRQVPTVLQRPDSPAFRPDQSGRWELVQSFVQPRHPLTARVLVNRVWRWHFGHGIVPSTDNFGLLGERPSHPELLDWLALRFTGSGWSLKWLHRQLVLSAAYQRDSAAPAALLQQDPENRLFGRAAVRRLEAEELRDALMAASGRLDMALGGSLLTVKNRAYFFDHTSRDLTDYSSTRRSLYLPVVRNNIHDVFQLMDYPDAAIPSSDRSTTTVAPQALMMLNSELVLTCSHHVAEHLLASTAAPQDRIQELYRVTLGRPAEPREVSGALDLVAAIRDRDTGAADSTRLAWDCLCQVVLASNEFLYVR